MEIRALGEHAKVRTNRGKFREVFLWVDAALIYDGEAAENKVIKMFYTFGGKPTSERFQVKSRLS